ncbi:MAG TPA: transglycosylase SLT domain-containing protein [Pyrinomonadaceae bacterium]
MNINFRKHRLILVIVGLVVVTGLSVSPFLSASCSTHQGSQGEPKALETLRNMTRGGMLPAEDAVTRIENGHPDTKTAALARIIRARIRIKAGDYAGAASLLDSKVITSRASIADYALLLRGYAFAQAGRRTEARAAYEQLAREYPASLSAREAGLRNAQMLIEDGQAAAVPVLLKDLNEKNDPAALMLSAKAYEQTNNQTQALGMYRRIYFFAPASEVSAEAAGAITRLGSTPSPASVEEALSRADRLFEAKRNADAASAYADAFSRFPAAATPAAQLRRGIAATNAKRTTDAVSALTSVPAGAGEQKAEALYYLSQAYATARQWDAVRGALDELRRAYPQSPFTPRAITNAGIIARDAKNTTEALNLFRQAVAAYPERAEVAQAQFEIAWDAHESKNYQESSRLLIEHLAIYADKNTDNRGRAGYWAARDAERAGKLAEARAIYDAMQSRYDANWYGYLSKQRLETMNRNNAPRENFAPDSIVGRAVSNLQIVMVADETAGQAEMERIARADEFSIIGTDDLALEELEIAQKAAPASPRVNLAVARIYRAREDNLRAFVELRKSYPDYSQMKPEELTREEWEIFYPLAYWDIITAEARAKRLDPHQVAGLIRQESVFNPRARSTAKAYGLMQLLVPTGAAMARKSGVSETITEQSLYQPRLNIQLGTQYMRDQFDKFGRIEYVAVAYNAGPGRVPQWRSTLPLEMDEFAEAIPFKETRGYVQGVVRNTLQYERLYDDNGQFRPEVGSTAINAQAGGGTPAQSANPMVRKRRVTGDEKEE